MNPSILRSPYAIETITSLLVMLLFPSTAFAYTLQCSNGVPSGGEVFLVNDCSVFSIANIFSGLNCSFQYLLNEVVKRMYCGIQYQLEDTLSVVILLYIIVYAIMFSLGLASLTAKELSIRMIKIALIWAFAMNASWGVGITFYFFSGGIETVITWVLGALTGGSMNGQGFFLYLDNLIFTQLTGGLSANGYALLGFFATLLVLMPPVFMLFLVYMITVLAALTRALVSYLLGLAAIAFLLSLGPIFVSMAMFKSTFTFFDSWLKYLISFALQIILIFAALALWIGVMSLFGNFFLDLANHIVPYEMIHSEAAFAFFKNTWGFCPYGKDVTGMNCIGGMAWPPSTYSNNAGLIFYLSVNLLALGTVVYAFDALLRAIPDLARQLSGPKYAPQLGGGTGFGAMNMPGFSGVNRFKKQLLGNAFSGVSHTFTSLKGEANKLSMEGGRAANFYNPLNAARQNAGRMAQQRRRSGSE